MYHSSPRYYGVAGAGSGVGAGAGSGVGLGSGVGAGAGSTTGAGSVVVVAVGSVVVGAEVGAGAVSVVVAVMVGVAGVVVMIGAGAGETVVVEVEEVVIGVDVEVDPPSVFTMKKSKVTSAPCACASTTLNFPASLSFKYHEPVTDEVKVMKILLLASAYGFSICTTVLPARIVPSPAEECPVVSVPAVNESAARDWKRAMPFSSTTPRPESVLWRLEVLNMLVPVPDVIAPLSSIARRASSESSLATMRSVRDARSVIRASECVASL